MDTNQSTNLSRNKIPTRNLGTQLQVSCQGLGCMGMSEFYGPSDEKTSLKTLKQALLSGINFFDTADVYGSGENEILLGKFLASEKRENIILATKCGIARDASAPLNMWVNNLPEYIIQCCEDSLKRLQTDYIDIFYLHRINEEPPLGAPLETSMQAFAKLLLSGKIRHAGISEVIPEQIERAHLALLKYTNGKHGLSVVQNEYSLLTRDVETDGTLEICNKYNIGLVAYSPLSRQLLSSGFNINNFDKSDVRRILPRFEGENLTQNLKIISALDEIAKEKNCTVTQLALAWLMAKGDYIVPIPGTRQENYLNDNINAIQIQLTPEDMARIDLVCPPNATAGGRYPEEMMKLANSTNSTN